VPPRAGLSRKSIFQSDVVSHAARAAHAAHAARAFAVARESASLAVLLLSPPNAFSDGGGAFVGASEGWVGICEKEEERERERTSELSSKAPAAPGRAVDEARNGD